MVTLDDIVAAGEYTRLAGAEDAAPARLRVRARECARVRDIR